VTEIVRMGEKQVIACALKPSWKADPLGCVLRDKGEPAVGFRGPEERRADCWQIG
jgi:hypothetical protein